MTTQPLSSPIVADVGISFGDEGKGRLIPELVAELGPERVGAVIKVNGGANSGHTAAGVKLNLLPAGVVTAGVPMLGIAAGVVADPRKFLWEGKPLEARGYQVFSRLRIDERCQVSDLTHRLLDLAWEDYRVHRLEEAPRGSTARGITPAYLDETGQAQIFYAVFRGSREAFDRLLARRVERTLDTIRHVCRVTPDRWSAFFDRLTEMETRANRDAIDEGIFPAEEFDFRRFRGAEPFTLNREVLSDTVWEAGRELVSRVGDLREDLLAVLASGRTIIGEFGQSYWLDKRHGFTPNVTASHTYTAEIFQSTGIPVQPVHTIGCAKAYDTKVGTHLFISEMPDDHPLAVRLKKLEFGTSTGRQRMVGWYDAVEKGDALRYGGFQEFIINKLDALGYGDDWFEGMLRVCVAYRTSDGEVIFRVPRDEGQRGDLSPVFEEVPSWHGAISTVRRFADLPDPAQRYVGLMVRSLLTVAGRGALPPKPWPRLRYIGVGPDPEEIIREIPETEDLIALAELTLS